MFNPKDLEGFPLWRAEYEALKAKHGSLLNAPVKPPREHVLPHRGNGRRKAPAPWIPTAQRGKR
nr:hypothetical protein [Veronia pacifica]